MIYLLLLHSIYALTYTVGKFGVLCSDPFFFIATRMIVGGVILMSYSFFMGKKIIPSHENIKKTVLGYCAIAFFLFYLGYAPDYAVLRYVDSSKWALLFTLSPFFIALFSYIRFKESITKLQIVGICIGFLGVTPVLYKNSSLEHLLGLIYFISVTELVILFSVICYSYGMTLLRDAFGYQKQDVIVVNGISMFMGGILLLFTSIYFDSWHPLPIYDYTNFAWTISAIVALHVFVFTINGYLMQWYTATFLTFLGFIDPWYTALYGWLFLGEKITFYFVFSLIFIFIGLYLFYRDERARIV